MISQNFSRSSFIDDKLIELGDPETTEVVTKGTPKNKTSKTFVRISPYTSFS
ncbi:hypothetical protein Oscil6304_4134 [Oscillatoria acuminata PCC 6304]|uniref:Uncharacterized protein n=1 Tax=Oscillatoria acuminata PCC 6304 TaxID=56110 RepID=K9TMM1_9CYAN|nr:hypothetical protein Oscil6304_4134 [Oscillatoria acuminata PCC 6304]